MCIAARTTLASQLCGPVWKCGRLESAKWQTIAPGRGAVQRMRHGYGSWRFTLIKRRNLLQIKAATSSAGRGTGNEKAVKAKLIASEVKSPRRVHVQHPFFTPSDTDDDRMEASPVFRSKDWQRHKGTSRYVRHVFSIPQSKLLITVAPVVLTFTTIAAAVVTWNHLVLQGALPAWAKILSSDPVAVNLMGPVLSILLAFRTNTSYQRFCEANKMWGDMLQRTRDLARQALTFMARGENGGDLALRALFLRFLPAFLITLKHHMLENAGDLQRELLLEARLSKDEVASLMQVDHRPIHVLHLLSMCIKNCDVHDMDRWLMDANLTCLMDNVGACERIFKTPVPEVYTTMVTRFISTWLVCLPFALWNSCRRMAVPIVLLMSTILLCIDQIGVMLEEPFGHLPLEDVVTTACRDVKDLVALSNTSSRLLVPVLTEGWSPLDNGCNGAPGIPAISELCLC